MVSRFLSPGRGFALAALLCVSSGSAFGSLVFNVTYNDATYGSNVAGVHTAMQYVTSQLSSLFSDNISINISVVGAAGGGLGQSSTSLISTSYANLRAGLLADATTLDDNTSVGVNGSVSSTDPVGTSHQWWVSRAQAKALGLLGNDAVSLDGTFTFGTGFTYAFDPANRAVSGEYDFIGLAYHEVTEIMGRIPGLGTTSFFATPSYLAMDLFRYTAPGTRGLTAGSGISFSIDHGTTLLKGFNFPNGGSSDPQDWDSATNDAFNAFLSPGAQSDLSATDQRVMDVLGFDLVSTPEPSTIWLSAAGLLGVLSRARRKIRR